jgi:hypothetical protein
MTESQTSQFLKKRNRASLLVLAAVTSWFLSYLSFISNHPGIVIGTGSSGVEESFWEKVTRDPFAFTFATFGALCMAGTGFVLYRTYKSSPLNNVGV